MLHVTINVQCHEEFDYLSPRKHELIEECIWAPILKCSLMGSHSVFQVQPDGWRALTGTCMYFLEWGNSWHCFKHPISRSLTVHYH